MFSKALSRLAAAVGGLVLAGAVPVSAAADNVVQTFELREHYGVNHPEQVIDFDLKEKADAGKVHVVGPDGEPVVFQLLNGGTKVAVLTDLPAGATRTWKLMSGAPPKKLPAPVQVTQTTANGLPAFAMTNQLMGVKVLGTFRPAAVDPRRWVTPSGVHRGLVGLGGWLFLPAPLQDVRMRDGKWAGPIRPGLGVEAKRLVKQSTRVLEPGPLRAAVEVTYQIHHDAYPGYKTVAAGVGTYRCLVRLEAGRSAALIEDETDLNFHWELDLYAAVRPDQFRYRGHVASKPEFGQNEDGTVYRPGHERPPSDAILPLKYDRFRGVSYQTDENSFGTVSPWNPWAGNGGWYWQMLNTKAGAKANVVGIFAARAGRALGVGFNGPGFWIKPAAKAVRGKAPATGRHAGISVYSTRHTPDVRSMPKTRIAWGLFVGTRADIKPVKEIQPINWEMNVLGGFNLNKVHRYTTEFDAPASGYGGLMMDRAAVAAIRKRLKDDKEGPYGKGYHAYLYQAYRELCELWAEAGREHFDKQVEAVLKLAHVLLEVLVNGNGVFDFEWHYWMGGNQMFRQLVPLDQLLGDPRCTAEQKTRLKAAAVLFGSVLWDDDFVPMQPDAGVNYGTPNMPVMMAMARKVYALFLATHPNFRDRAREVLAQAPKDLHWLLDENGVPQQCPGYIEASVTPVVSLLAMCKQRGRDPFQGQPRAGKFADFYLNLLTPPEPRIPGRPRVLVTLGDTGLDPSALYGLVGTALRDADPKASARLLGAWQQSNKPHRVFVSSTVVAIDETLRTEDPSLGDYSAANYYSVLRHGWGTPDESALYFVTGDRYHDHRHADPGSIVLYALGKPLVQDWASVYTPHVGGSYMHNGCTLEKSLPFPWDRDGASALEAGTFWHKSTPLAYESFPEGAMSRARFEANVTPAGSDAKKPRSVTWTRTVVALRPRPAQPIYVLRDEFDPASADLKKVLTLNVMADRPVQTPAGAQNPQDRMCMYGEDPKDPKHLPYAGPPMPLSRGANRFAFTGRYSVDCDVFVLADHAEALVGRWGAGVATSHMPDGSPERQERQHILRVRTSGPVTTVIVPQRHGEKGRDMKFEADGDTVIVRSGEDIYRIAADGYTVETKQTGKVSRSWSAR